MKRVMLVGVSLTMVAGLVMFAGPAVAAPGTLSGPSATISWDDTTWYVPTGCTQYPINYTTTEKNLTSDVTFIGPYGDSVGSGGIYGQSTSGTATVQVCSFELDGLKGDIPLILRFKDGQDFTHGDGSDQIFQASIVLHARPSTATTTTPAASAPTATPNVVRVKCISKKTFKKKWFVNVTKCPKGWVKI